MGKLLVGVSAVALGLIVNIANAADYPARPMPPPEVWNWTGFYLGGNLGYSGGRSDTDARLVDNTTGALLSATQRGFDMNGVVGGGQVGANWQTGIWVLGVEADIQSSGQKGSTSATCSVSICNLLAVVAPTELVSATLNQRLQWFGTARARVGALGWSTTMIYGTAGFAYGRIKSEGLLSGFTIPGLSAAAAFNSSTLQTGWTAGVGGEVYLGGNWTARIEYLYVDFGSVGPSVLNSAMGPPVRLNLDSAVTDHIVRGGLNFKF